MHDNEPEFELQEALDLFWDEKGPLDSCETGMPGYFVRVPSYVLQDAVERLKRYSVIVENLTKVGNYLWMENLRKYGERKVHSGETPWGSNQDPTFKSMSAFVNRIEDEITIDDAYVELALSICRIKSGDPTGLNGYLDKEEELFEQLDGGDSIG